MSCQIHLRVKTMAFRVLCIGLNSFALNSTSYVLFNEITKPIEFPVLKPDHNVVLLLNICLKKGKFIANIPLESS